MIQHGIKAGLKLFGNEGAEAVVKEMTQLHIRDVISPKFPHQLSKEDHKKALHYLMFLKKKTERKHQRTRLCRWQKTAHKQNKRRNKLSNGRNRISIAISNH